MNRQVAESCRRDIGLTRLQVSHDRYRSGGLKDVLVETTLFKEISECKNEYCISNFQKIFCLMHLYQCRFKTFHCPNP